MNEHVFDGNSDRALALEAAVLRLALVAWPRRLTRAQIARRLRAGEPELAAAIRRLLAAGLLVRDDAHLVPSAAALRFDRLPID